MMDFYEAFHYLNSHPIFHGHFLSGCLEIDVVKVDPATNRIEYDEEKNTKTAVWFEACLYNPENSDSPYDTNFCLDPALCCGGDSFEEAIIELAEKVKEKYGTDRQKKNQTDSIMTVKEFLENLQLSDILLYINQEYGPTYFDDYCALRNTYRLLTNAEQDTLDPLIPEKYDVTATFAISKSNAAHPIIYFKLCSKKRRHYEISTKFVKRVCDFSQCQVRGINGDLLEFAAALLLSFAVLQPELQELYEKTISPLEYIIDTKHRPRLTLQDTPYESNSK